MSNINYDHVEDFLHGIDNSYDFIDEIIYAKQNNLPIMRKETANFIKTFLKITNPKNILEIGTCIGYSTMIFKKYSSAKITTIELSKENFEIAKDNFRKYGYEINLINDDAKKALDYINQGFDFVFIDAEKSHLKNYFDKVTKILNKNGVIVCDNVLYKGMISNDDLIERRDITIVKRIREFLVYINDLKEYRTSIIPIGDGISISIKE